MKQILKIITVFLILAVAGFFIWRGEKKSYCGDVFSKMEMVEYGSTVHYLILYNKLDTIKPFITVKVESQLYPLFRIGEYTCQMAYKNQVK